jgi:hypothetical protein
MSAKKPKKRAQLTLVGAAPTTAGLQGRTSGQKTEYGLLDKLYARIEGGNFADPKLDDPKYDTAAHEPLWNSTPKKKRKQKVAKKTSSPRKKKQKGKVLTPKKRSPLTKLQLLARKPVERTKYHKPPGLFAVKKKARKYTDEKLKKIRSRRFKAYWEGRWSGKKSTGEKKPRKSQAKYTEEQRKARRSEAMKKRWDLGGQWIGKRKSITI